MEALTILREWHSLIWTIVVRIFHKDPLLVLWPFCTYEPSHEKRVFHAIRVQHRSRSVIGAAQSDKYLYYTSAYSVVSDASYNEQKMPWLGCSGWSWLRFPHVYGKLDHGKRSHDVQNSYYKDKLKSALNPLTYHPILGGMLLKNLKECHCH